VQSSRPANQPISFCKGTSIGGRVFASSSTVPAAGNLT
jgi:hypothetical protein